MAEGKRWFTFRKPEDPVKGAEAKLEQVHEAFNQAQDAYVKLKINTPPSFRKQLDEQGDTLEALYKRFAREGTSADEDGIKARAAESVVLERDIQEHQKALFSILDIDPTLVRNPEHFEVEYPLFFMYQQMLNRLMDALVAFEDSAKKVAKSSLNAS